MKRVSWTETMYSPSRLRKPKNACSRLRSLIEESTNSQISLKVEEQLSFTHLQIWLDKVPLTKWDLIKFHNWHFKPWRFKNYYTRTWLRHSYKRRGRLYGQLGRITWRRLARGRPRLETWSHFSSLTSYGLRSRSTSLELSSHNILIRNRQRFCLSLQHKYRVLTTASMVVCIRRRWTN